MAFQTSVNFNQGFGVIGEIITTAPTAVQPATLNSGTAANNVFGRAFTWSSGKAAAGGVGAFLGIMVQPKENASNGTSVGGTLAATLTLRNGEKASFLTMGDVLVDVGGAASVGDLVVYNTTTGVLAAIDPDDYLPAGHAYAYGVVARVDASSNGLAIVSFNYVPTAPVAA